MPKRPRLYFVTPQFGRTNGGVGVSAERFTSLLRDRCDFVVITPDRELQPGTYSRKSSPGLELVNFGQMADLAHARQFVSDVLVHLHGQMPASRILGFYAAELSYAAVLSAGLIGVPFDTFVRGNDVDLGMFGSSTFELFETFGRAEQIFCVTRELRHKVSVFVPGTDPIVVPNGVDPVEFPMLERKGSTGKTVVGLFGDIKPKKGLEFLLSALDWEQCELRIVGGLRPDAAKSLQAFSQLYPESLSAITHVPFVKTVPDLLDEIGRVDIVSVPSHHEGMANIMLEAMSCGKVLLCSAVGGALDVIRHNENGFLHVPRDVDSFRVSLSQAISAARDSKNPIGLAARQTIEKDLSIELERKRYRQYYS
ncbi:MAG: glycosyltransferase family 4 protein [Bdellovibrionota bacterium]